jgi:hypothetical protein
MPRGVHRGCAGATRRGPVARATGTRRLEVVRDAMIEVTMEDGPKIGRMRHNICICCCSVDKDVVYRGIDDMDRHRGLGCPSNIHVVHYTIYELLTSVSIKT